MHSPLDQFTVKTLIPFHIGGVDLSFTNSSLFMMLTALGIFFFLGLGLRKKAIVPGPLQSLAEMSYELVLNMLKDNVGDAGKR